MADPHPAPGASGVHHRGRVEKSYFFLPFLPFLSFFFLSFLFFAMVCPLP